MAQNDGSFEVSFITSRSRVAPLKEISLPRLELLGALLCARLICFVQKALKLSHVSCHCWTDSMVTLSWIKGEPSRWKTFVANRAREILKLTSPDQWSHCPGKGNPADLLTRGIYAEQLISSAQWLHGPDWLSEQFSVPGEISFETVEQFLQSEKIATVAVASFWIPYERVLEVERWSTFEKAIRVTGLVLRFITNTQLRVEFRRERVVGDMTLDEYARAKRKLFSHIQYVTYGAEIENLKEGKPVSKSSSLLKLSPVVGNDGLLRVGGRLEYSELTYAEKHPIILPRGHFSVLIVRSEHKRLKHAGVETMLTNIRDEYWIIGARRIAKAVKKDCFLCQLKDARSCNQVAAPLPELRVHQAPVFTVTGLDYGGPLFCIDFPEKKFYILLFTCAVVRAIHLELTESLEVADCVLALRRFFARRGLPSILYSDNAKTFKGTERVMIEAYGTVFPKWKNIAPRSPWWGGWWERLIRSVKSALKKTIGNRCLTKVELETTLCEVEACINCRPLTFVGDEIDSTRPLTPSHFLVGRNLGFQTVVDENEVEVSQEHLSEIELIRQRRLELFWSVWSKDYLRNLPPVVNGFGKQGNVGVGSIVLIREDNIPRMKWPLGVITRVFPGKDGLVRSVEVKTVNGLLVRPIQRLHDLEVQSGGHGGSMNVPPASLSADGARVVQNPAAQGADNTGTARGADGLQGAGTSVAGHRVTRHGRVSKPRKRLDL